MSGIAAVFHLTGRPAAAQDVGPMLAAMDCRGPDGRATWHDGPVCLGAGIFHTTAEARTVSQPVASSDGAVQLLLDGYLTDPAGLRRKLALRGLTPRGVSDEELILLAWQAWDEACPTEIEGEYALVLWDARRQHLFCARDHQGLRSLFYHCDGERLVVASDIVGVLAALAGQPALNLGYVAEVLEFEFYTREETIWHGVTRLVQAHWLKATRDGLATRQYWSLDVTRRQAYKGLDECAEHYREVLAQCVIAASRTDHALAFEVSGGLDSTSLFCMAHHLQGQDRLLAPQMRGYTLAGPVGTRADEIAYPRAVAAELGVTIAEFPYYMPPLESFAADARAAMDMPMPPNGIMAREMEQAMVADGCRVCISGVGGDQWLDGSRFYYHELARTGEWRRLLAATRRDVAALGWRDTARTVAYYGLSPAIPDGVRSVIRRWRGTRDHALITPGLPLVADLASELAERKARYLATLPTSRHAARKIEAIEHPSWSVIFDLCARLSAQATFEPRYPMLDRRFIDFAAAVPDDMLLQGDTYRVLHRHALVGILPDTVRLRRDKATTNVTYDRLNQPISHVLTDGFQPDWHRVLDRAVTRRLADIYCTAPIDNAPLVSLWGPYAVTLMLGLQCDASG